MRGYVLVLLGLLSGALCMATPEEKDQPPQASQNVVNPPARAQLEEVLLRKLNTKCSQKDTSSCVMLKLVSYMDRMLKKAAIQVGDDLEITRNSSITEDAPITEDTSRSDEGSEDDQITQLLLDKVWTFVRTRSLRWKLFNDAELVITNNPDADGNMNLGMSITTADTENGRGKNKNIGPFLAAAAMKIGLLGGLAFKGLALLVGKALLVAKIALLLASIIGLKKLFSHQKHVTYEVVSHPHHSHESSGGHDTYSSGWGRSAPDFLQDLPATSGQDPHSLAYAAQVPQNQDEKIE